MEIKIGQWTFKMLIFGLWGQINVVRAKKVTFLAGFIAPPCVPHFLCSVLYSLLIMPRRATHKTLSPETSQQLSSQWKMKWTLPSRPLQSTAISTSNTKVGPPYGASNIDVFSMFLTRNPQLYNKVHIMVVSLEWGEGYCNPHNSSLVALSCLSTIPHGLSGNWSSAPLNGPLHQFLALRDTRSCVGSAWTTEPCNLIPPTCRLNLFIYIFA